MNRTNLGRWANMRLAFIKENRPQLYESLQNENRLMDYLLEFETQAQRTLTATEEQMRKAEKTTEELKRENPLEWVRRMNNVRSRAEEITITELVNE